MNADILNTYRYNDIKIGLSHSFERIITKDMESSFREITGDQNPMHIDDEYAKEHSYSEHIMFGMLTASFYSTLAGMYLPGKYSLIHSIDIKLTNPVYLNDKLTISGIVKEKEDSLNLIIVKAIIKNQDGKTVSKANIKIICLE